MSVYVFSGAGVKKIFKNEVGTHSWQRVPPTEKRGRLHTSSIKVTLLDKPQHKDVEVRPDEVSVLLTKGDGGGGQHRDKTMSCVIMTHTATGIKVTENGRKQHTNKKNALKAITKKVNEFYRTGLIQQESDERNEQLTEDKRRTYKVKSGLVEDHITGKSTKLKNILRGKIELLA